MSFTPVDPWDSRAPQMAAVTWTFLFLSSIAVALRIYCRAWVIKAFSYDDWLAVCAQILFVIFCIYELVGITYGTGQHHRNIDPQNLPKAIQVRTQPR